MSSPSFSFYFIVFYCFCQIVFFFLSLLTKLLLLSCGMVKCPEFVKYYSKIVNFSSISVSQLHLMFISSNALWCRLEPKSCLSTSLQALLTAPLPINLSIFTDNLVVISTFRIWSQFRRYFKFISAFSLMALFMNHSFPPSVTDPVFVM